MLASQARDTSSILVSRTIRLAIIGLINGVTVGAKAKKGSKGKASGANKKIKLDAHYKRLFNDRLFRWFLYTGILLGVLSVSLLLFRVRSVEYAVPLQFYTPQGFDNLGAWYRAYTYGLFGLLTTAGNITLAAISYDKSRIASFFLVMGMLVINLFLLIVVIALTNNLEV